MATIQNQANMYMIIHFMGSKRTGPDLMRVGGKYNHNWHFNHMWSPQATSTGSIMPAYKWLFDNKTMDHSDVQKKNGSYGKIRSSLYTRGN